MSHTCLVRPGGAVSCWGANARRQVGVAAPSTVLAPADVAGVTGAVAVTAGSSHTCALLEDGTVTCWGSNASGQLGNGLVAPSSAPVAVQGLTGINAVAAGEAHTCALRNDGTVWCWGSNASGRLGDGTTTRRLAPVKVSGLADVKAIVAGASHSCALTYAGLAYCWGGNGYGQLGDGSRVARRTPVAVSGGTAWRSLAAGQSHTCGVAQAPGNAVLCWGRNNVGQLADGSIAAYQLQPVPALEADGSPLTDGVLVSAGGTTSCLVRGNGSAACWGSNTQGQAGDGSTASPRRAPVAVAVNGAPLAGAFLLVSSGASHTCALAVSGELFCWGNNSYGQLGNDTRTRRTSPVRIGANDGRTFGAFGAEDDLAAVNGAGATSLLARSDALYAAGLSRAGDGDAWVVRRSRDRGANWVTATSYTFASGSAMQAPHLGATASGTLFLAGAAADDDGNTAWVVVRSSDGGDGWSDVDAFIFDRGHTASLRAIAVDASDRILTAGSAEDATGSRWLVRASADLGETWFIADDYAASGAEAHAILDAGSAGLFVAGHVMESGHARLRVRTTGALVASDRATLWTDANDFQSEAGYDTFGESLAADLGGRIFLLARANGASGWQLLLRASTDGGSTWRTLSTFQVAGVDTEGYRLLVDRAGTLHVAGRSGSGASAHGIVASSFDHGATWVLADAGATTLTDLAEDPTGAIHAAGTSGSGAAAHFTVRSRSCLGVAPSCGNFIIDPGELCDGNCSDCSDHDACTTDVMSGSPTTCDVTCTSTPITTCVSGDGCCAPGCTSAEDLDCCTGPIEDGACVDVSFELDALSTTGCTTLEQSPITGTSRGGLAVSSSEVFYTGNGPANRGTTGRFSATDLTGGRATIYAWTQLLSNVRTGDVYVLASGVFPLGRPAGTANTLIPLNPVTGAPVALQRVTLSQRIPLAANRAIFSGYGRAIIYSGARVYDVQLPSGRVTDLGSMVLPQHNTCPDAGAWGLAESFGGALYVDYAAGNELKRTRVPDGRTTTLQAFTNLGDTCAIGFLAPASRWYFHHTGTSQFATGTETLGTCTAAYRRPNATPVCGDGLLEAAETCDGDCPASCDDGASCTTDHQAGAPSTCNMACTHAPITTCTGGDGCCVAGCNAVQDDDCPSTCGNGVIEPGETCDGDCPTSCDDGNTCTTDALTGSSSSCDASCANAAISVCASGDGCCAPGCSPAADDDCTPLPGVVTVVEHTGVDQTYRVPAGVSTLTVKLWGAGGGSGGAGYGLGGAGGFARAVLAVTPGETLTFVVGGGGRIFSGGPSTPGSYGGGGYSTWYSGAGGGYSGIFRGTVSPANALIIAGGGGGGGYPGFDGGAGGGLAGTRDTEVENAYPGTQTGGGTTGGGTANAPGTAGSALQGGHGGDGSYGGGGGGGYFGGGAGSTNGGRVGAGAGGAAFIGAAGTCNPTTQAGVGVTPPETADPSYRGGIGAGGAGSGGDGLIHVTTGGSCFAIVAVSPTDGAELAWDTTEVHWSVTTSGSGACRYAASPGQAFAAMTPLSTTGGRVHAATLSGATSGTTYDFYVKCQETADPSNILADRRVRFSVASAYASVAFIYTGAGQTFTVPAGISTISVKSWGAGGGGGMYYSQTHGGAGGFAAGDVAVTPGESLEVVVGGGGAYTNSARTAASYGGGGYACWYGGAGGGYSGVFRGGVAQANALVIAGGGGGGGWDVTLFEGGPGGGLSGSRDARAPENAYPGTQSGGGATGSGGQEVGTAGSALQGVHGGAVYGGGGGGGYFGGGGGATSGGRVGAGGGGSAFLGAALTNAVTEAGTGATPPRTSDSDYASGVGVGGYTNAGGHGRVVITYHR